MKPKTTLPLETRRRTMLPTFDIPPIGPWQGKCWGRTRLLFHFNSVELHLIEAKPGYRCSRHYHTTKWNRFAVISGVLNVRIFGDGRIDETIVGPGQVTDVPPGVLHEFEALEDAVAVECYWVALDPQDIVREILGGPVE